MVNFSRREYNADFDLTLGPYAPLPSPILSFMRKDFFTDIRVYPEKREIKFRRGKIIVRVDSDCVKCGETSFQNTS